MQALAWRRRPEALTPAGLVSTGAVTQGVLAHLRDESAERLARLAVVATRDMLVLLGANADLPWVDGVRYCAPDPLAQSLWLPTSAAPVLAADLLARRAMERSGGRTVLLWNEPEQMLPLDRPHSLNVALLDWLMEASA